MSRVTHSFCLSVCTTIISHWSHVQLTLIIFVKEYGQRQQIFSTGLFYLELPLMRVCLSAVIVVMCAQTSCVSVGGYGLLEMLI